MESHALPPEGVWTCAFVLEHLKVVEIYEDIYGVSYIERNVSRRFIAYFT